MLDSIPPTGAKLEGTSYQFGIGDRVPYLVHPLRKNLPLDGKLTVMHHHFSIADGMAVHLLCDTVLRFLEPVVRHGRVAMFGQQGGGFRLRLTDAGLEQGEVVGDGFRLFGRVIDGLRI